MKVQFMKNIENVFDSELSKFIKMVSTVYKIDENDLVKMWRGDNGGNNEKVQQVEVQQQVVEAIRDEQIPPQSGECNYVVLRGVHKGSLCGKKVKGGCVLCSRHNKKPVDAAAIPKERKTPLIPKPIDVMKTSKVLRRNKSIDKLWHEETGMVFNSVDDRTVVNKCTDGKLCDLTDDDVTICERMGFAYRRSSDTKTDDAVKPKKTVVEVAKKTDEDSVVKPKKTVVEVAKKTDEDSVVKPKKTVVEVAKKTDEDSVVKPTKTVVEDDDTIDEVEKLLNQLQVSLTYENEKSVDMSFYSSDEEMLEEEEE
uniref:Uncharacterized protein n=1 Tax=viral metagenome TaxID=1070528 RepID=A0A6C0LU61_9ZZZZ